MSDIKIMNKNDIFNFCLWRSESPHFSWAPVERGLASSAQSYKGHFCTLLNSGNLEKAEIVAVAAVFVVFHVQC